MQDQREEENKRDWVGNMNVVERCPTHGYMLQCACNNIFEYVPNGTNSCLVDGKSKALCPECHVTWNQKAEPRFTEKLHRYVVMMQTEKGNYELELVGVGQARSPGAIMLSIYSQLEATVFTGLSILEVDKDQYDGAAEELMAKKRESMMSGFLGFLLGELGGKPDDKDPDKKRRRRRDH